MLQWIPAAVALGGAAIAGLFGLVQRFGGLPNGTEVGFGRMLGRGPYTSVACPPSHELAQKLASTLDELREAAREGNWSINWGPLDECCRKALAADEGGNYAEAIRQLLPRHYVCDERIAQAAAEAEWRVGHGRMMVSWNPKAATSRRIRSLRRAAGRKVRSTGKLCGNLGRIERIEQSGR